jgi:predicted TIM-barrel enzyme
MPELPFGEVIDPRDVAYEATAGQVRVEVWEGVSPTHGGTCTTYAAPLARLADALAWQRANPALQVNVGITVWFNAEVLLVTVAPHSAVRAT